MTKASIVLPVWNAERCIETCINSIKRQTLEDFECIVVNDGSTDNTVETARNAIADDERFQIVSTSHEGLSNARNVGIDRSNSDIIFHVDADDEPMPEMLNHAVEFLTVNDLEIVFFDVMPRFDDSLSFMEKSVTRYFTRRRNYGIQSGKMMFGEMVANRDIVYAAFIQAIRKSAIREKFHYGLRAQDILYTTKNFYLAEQIGHLPEILYVKNVNPDSISNSKHDAHYIQSLLTTIKELQSFAERKCGNHSRSIEFVISQVFQFLLFAIKHLEKDDWKDISEMSIADRTLIVNLARTIFVPSTRRQLEEDLFSNENLNSF